MTSYIEKADKVEKDIWVRRHNFTALNRLIAEEIDQWKMAKGKDVAFIDSKNVNYVLQQNYKISEKITQLNREVKNLYHLNKTHYDHLFGYIQDDSIELNKVKAVSTGVIIVSVIALLLSCSTFLMHFL